MELLDGRRLLVRGPPGLEGPAGLQRSLAAVATHDTGFIQYMESGIWHLAVYNDGKDVETVSFLTSAVGELPRRAEKFESLCRNQKFSRSPSSKQNARVVFQPAFILSERFFLWMPILLASNIYFLKNLKRRSDVGMTGE